MKREKRTKAALKRVRSPVLLCTSLLLTSSCSLELIGGLSGGESDPYTSDPGARVCDEVTETLTVEPIYTAGSNWTDYVRRSDTNTLCDGTESHNADCIHSGERRKVELSEITTCENLVAVDSEEAFEWWCDDSSGNAVFKTRTFNWGKGLGNFIEANPFPEFKEATVTISYSNILDCTLGTTTSSTWWGNDLAILPDNSSGGSTMDLTAAGTLYVGTESRDTDGFRVTVAKSGVILLPGVEITFAGGSDNCNGSESTVCLEGNFGYVEGVFKGSGTDTGILSLYSTKFSYINNAHMQPPTGGGISDYNGSANLIANSSITDGGQFDLYGPGSRLYRVRSANSSINSLFVTEEDIWIQEFSASNSLMDGLAAGGDADDVILTQLTISNMAGSGLDTRFLDFPTVQFVTTVNHIGYGIIHGDNDSVSSNVIALNNADVGFEHGNNNVIYNAISAHNDGYGIWADGNNIEVYGFLSTGNNGNNACQIDGASNLLNASCDHGTALAFAADSVSYNSTGVFSSTSIQEDLSDLVADPMSWFSGNFFQSFGKLYDLANFPNSNFRDRCSGAETCERHSYQLRIVDTVGGPYSLGEGAEEGEPCPDILDPTDTTADSAIVITDNQTPSHTYLAQAYEIWGDDVGNENGLCESDERCIYNPNIGSYAGEPDSKLKECTMKDGPSVSGVEMYFYETNGI